MEELEKNKNKRKIYISLLVTVLCIIGVSYAFFMIYLRQSDNNSVTALSCFASTLTEENSALNLENEFPISDENGMKKTPFTFKVTNNCDNYVKIYITIDPLKEGTTNYIPSKYIKANVSSKDTTDGQSLIVGNQSTKVLENKDNGFILKEVILPSKESKEFDLRIWIDYDTTKEQAAGMTYPSQVVIVTEPISLVSAPNEWFEAMDGTLIASIRNSNELKTPLTIPGSEVNAHTQDDVESQTTSVSSTYQSYYITYGTGWEANGTNFNLTGTAVTSDVYANSYSSLVGKYLPNSIVHAGSSTAGTMKTTINLDRVYYVVNATQDSFTYKILSSNKNVTEALLASTEDDYGTSYYFRGAVKNNYVQFANKCWRIVRITGDGSVKLVLHNDNTSGASNPCSSVNNSNTAAFAKYSGSTYITAFNSIPTDNAYVGFMYGAIGASDYASTHANTNKSEILTNLEMWYKNNLASYENKLADTIWCNDKSTINSKFGYGTNSTTYSTYDRINQSSSPSLICANDNNGGKLSKFTVSDTTNGNAALTYKVGLLTADEIVFSGSIFLFYYNSSTYLQENTGITTWCSLSPGNFDGIGGSVWYVEDGRLNYVDYLSDGYGLRPAVALVSSTIISGGTGTSEDPYIVN